MATGDLKNNLKKLQAAIKSIKYEKDVDIESLSKGIPGSFLPIYHFVFIEYSRFVAEKITELNIELYGKADLRFIEGMYKVLRELFSYKPALTRDQFFSNGFAEKKVIMCTDILHQVRSMHLKLAPKPRPKTAPTNMTSSLVSNLAASAVNHKTQPAPSAANKAIKQPKPVPSVKDATNNPVARSAAFSDIGQAKQAPAVEVYNELHQKRNINTSAGTTAAAATQVQNELHQKTPSGAVHVQNELQQNIAGVGTGRMHAPIIQVQNELHQQSMVHTVAERIPAPVVYVQNELQSQSATGEASARTPVAAGGSSGVHVYPDLRVPQAMPQTYNPSAYATQDANITPVPSLVEIEQQNVEVVSLSSDISEDDCHVNIRPIDMIAKTPGKSLVHSHVQRNTGDTAQVAPNLMLLVEEKLTSVAENVSRLVDRVQAVEEKLSLLEAEPRGSSVTEEAVENVMARLTLLENNFKLIKAQVTPAVGREEQSFADSLEKQTFENEPRTAHPDLNTRHLVQSLLDGQNAITSPAMTSTPVEPIQRLKDACNKENAVPQAERIKAMLKETESMLNMNVESPVRKASVNEAP